ncbi:MFS transporter [Mucilaginibacter antarcticus]|uniref:MFS transporter n=1 Tax=Mucilaginibacter antarcticus TaxID=1855725 RepID=A0ABW5XKN0_9SPHI
MKSNKNLWILVFICIINSIGFGIIVPLLYTIGKKYGATPQTIGLLTAAFSVAQFIATPFMGALSDRFGRKPLLTISLIGTCISFLMFTWAESLMIIFAARILDGLTGGNISVAQAMVTDTSTAKDRAKKFGFLSSAFGFGFVIGPAAGGLLNELGPKVPFYFAAAISLTGILLTMFFLEETNPAAKRSKAKKDSKFSFKSLVTVLKMPAVGLAILVGFLLTTAQFTMLIGFQTFTLDILKLKPTQIGIFYAAFGVSGILGQLIVPGAIKFIKAKSVILLISTALCLAAMAGSGFTAVLIPFAICIFIYGIFNGLRNPMLNAIIADHNDPKRQGEVMGVNQAYISLGQVIGPITAGFVAVISVHTVFWLASFYILIALLFSFMLKAKA